MRKSDNLPVTFTKSDVEIIARETRYRGFFSLDVYRFRHRLFNGEMSGEVKREIFERGHAAVLLPFDPERDEVVLVRTDSYCRVRHKRYAVAAGDGRRHDRRRRNH